MHYRETFQHILLNRELDELYIVLALRNFALSLIGVFLPIYLILLGYPLKSIIWLYIIMHLTHALMALPAAKIAAKIGLKHMIMLSMPILVSYFVLIGTIEAMHWPLGMIGLIGGLQASIFWIGYHIDFSVSSNKKERAREVAIASTFSSLATSLAPAIGGVILGFLDIRALIIVVTIVLIASIIPLFFTKDIHESFKFTARDIRSHKTWKESVAYIGNGIEVAVASLFWPLFIYFTIFNDYTKLGYVSTATSIFILVSTLFIAKIANKHNSTILRIGGVLNVFMWIWKAFVTTSIGVYAVKAAHGVTGKMVTIAFNTKSYDKAQKNYIAQEVVIREFGVHIGQVALFIITLFISDITISFFFGAAASIVYLLF